MAIPLSNFLRALFLVMGCLMVGTLVYTIYVDGFPFRRDLLTPWMIATLVDFYINVIAVAAWICYKESNFIIATIWILLLICFGSITTSVYIFIQFLKLSPEESLQDPVHRVLLRHESKGVEQKMKQSAVMSARIAFSVLGFLMLGTLIFTLLTDGSPFRKELLTPWMVATLIDFYINVVALSVWVAYKESSLISGFLWILLLICFGSITTCAYIVKQLVQLTSQDPVYLILFNRGNRAENRYERT
ncbi:Phospho-N-acetylmuramoyl-pentapeptide-transferase [Populus alba x Populus x berolinensis]|nr:Phospho-N-acetylmuramoyl-pentapeptide-transferase [Populus alba x Populus x berolinensis]